jgi:hypothetical protein
MTVALSPQIFSTPTFFNEKILQANEWQVADED